MTVTFKCKTGEAYQIKVLAELLTNNLKTGCFEVNENGLYLRMFDQPRKTLVDLSLLAENFALYKIKKDDLLLPIDLILHDPKPHCYPKPIFSSCLPQIEICLFVYLPQWFLFPNMYKMARLQTLNFPLNNFHNILPDTKYVWCIEHQIDIY